MINNLLFGGEAWAGIHESKLGTTRKRQRTKQAWDAHLLQHPLGVMFATRIIPLGVEMYVTPLGEELFETTGMTRNVRERQVFEGPQAEVKRILRNEILKRNLL